MRLPNISALKTEERHSTKTFSTLHPCSVAKRCLKQTKNLSDQQKEELLTESTHKDRFSFWVFWWQIKETAWGSLLLWGGNLPTLFILHLPQHYKYIFFSPSYSSELCAVCDFASTFVPCGNTCAECWMYSCVHVHVKWTILLFYYCTTGLSENSCLRQNFSKQTVRHCIWSAGVFCTTW